MISERDSQTVPSNDRLITLMRADALPNPGYRNDRGLYNYEDILGITVLDIAKQSLKRSGGFCWYDMCCGEFRAGSRFMRGPRMLLDTTNDHLEVRGIDINTELEDDLLMHGGSIISRGNVVTYPIPVDSLDLITSVEGLYLIKQYMGFGSVLRALENWYSGLRKDGLLAIQNSPLMRGYDVPFHILDYLRIWSNETGNNVVDDDGFKQGFHYDHNSYIRITKTVPSSELHFPDVSEEDASVIPVDLSRSCSFKHR